MVIKKTPYDKAIQEASKKLPFAPTKQTNALLEHAADDMADAYRIGAEEAQAEIVTRLRILKEKEENS